MARILIAEDDKTSARLYARILENREHLVELVDNGANALAALDAFKPDIVILDVLLPGKDGYEVCREIRQSDTYFNVPILMASSQDNENDIMKGFDCGADEYILKPIRKTELTTKIDILLKRKINLTRPTLAPDTRIDQRYLVLDLLSQNENTAVYLAKDTEADPPVNVALKVINHGSRDSSLIPRFLREVESLRRVDHPNIVRAINYKREGECFYVAMEFVSGRSLASIIQERLLSEPLAVALGMELTNALEELSHRHMIHRDIKPGNIIISNSGSPVLIDFGLAKAQGQETVTLRDQMYGTPQYVSPEYIKGAHLDIKTDIYSLGVTLYYAVSGILPFFADNHLTIFHKHLTETPPPLRDVKHGVSDDFSDLVDSMLLKNPKHRCDLETLRQSLHREWDKIQRNQSAPKQPNDTLRDALFSID